MKPELLVNEAIKVMEHSYAPYSSFNVGAALLAKSGRVYHGCNIENAAFSPTNCAERTAFFKAISEGERHFSAIAVVAGTNGVVERYSPPCGVCRQVMHEFCDKDFIIYLYDGKEITGYKLSELLPHGFDL